MKNNKTLFSMLTAILLFIMSSQVVQSKEDQLTMNLSAMVNRTHLLTPTSPSVTDNIKVDSAETVSLIFGSASKTLAINLIAPNGNIIKLGDPNTTTSRNMIFPDPNDPASTGANYLFVLENPQAGNWSYTVSETGPLTANRAVLLTFTSSSTVRTGIIGGGEDYRVDRDIRLAIVTIDGTTVAKNVNINATLTKVDDTSFPPTQVTFKDDGSDGDKVAGDGLFTASFQPNIAGNFSVNAVVSGTSSSGQSYERTAFALFRVNPVLANFTGTFTDHGIDLDGDNLLDQIAIAPDINIITDGEYNLVVTLQGSNGTSITANNILELAAGNVSPEVLFSTQNIKQYIGVNGPYKVLETRLEFFGMNPPATADAAFDLGDTAAYMLNQLQRKKIEFIGTGSKAEGSDSDNNGKFDFLDVSLPVDFLNRGNYSWSARLVDQNGTEVALASGNDSFEAGTAMLLLRFNGPEINANGVDGPFFVRNFIVFGNNESLTVTETLTTPAITANQFDSFTNTVAKPIKPKDIPTLSEWAMIILSIIIMLIGFFYLRQSNNLS